MSPAANTVPGMPSSNRAVASSCVRVQSAMSPAPTNTGSPPAAVTTMVRVAEVPAPSLFAAVRVTV
jgi:hypothetical protein